MGFWKSHRPPTVKDMYGKGDEEGLKRVAGDLAEPRSARCQALQALGAMRARDAEAVAKMALTDPAPEGRMAAAALLAHLGDPIGTGHLTQVRDDPGASLEARAAAAWILRGMGHEDTRKLLRRFDASGLGRVEILVELIAARVIVERDLEWLATSKGELRETILGRLRSALRTHCLDPELTRRVEAALRKT